MLFQNEPASSSAKGGATRPTRKTVFQMMDGTFRIYRDNAAPLMVVSALTLVPTTLIGAFVASAVELSSTGQIDPTTMSSEAALALCFGGLLSIVLGIAQVVIMNGVAVTVASEAQFGNRLLLREAWALSVPRFGALLGGYVRFYVLLVLLIIAGGIVGALCPPVLLVFALVLYMSITIGSLIAPVAMLEGRPGAALSRAHLLAKSRFWAVFGISLLVGLVSFGISLIIEFVISDVLFAGINRGTTGAVLQLTLSMVSGIIIAPLLPIAMTQAYYDARIRREDLEVTLAAIGPEARPADVAPLVSDESWFSGPDILNIVVLIGVIVVLFLVGGAALAAILNVLAPGLGDIVPTGGIPL